MSLHLILGAQRGMRTLTTILGVTTAVLVALAVKQGTNVEGRLLPAHMRGMVPWKTISAQDMDRGTSAPPNTNVVVQFPEKMDKISLDVLSGYRSKNVRFWGYCFPQNYDRAAAVHASGFPGTVFLSRKERQERAHQQLNLRRDRFSIFKDLTEKDLNQDRTYGGLVQHERETFNEATSCYLMSAGPLPIGTDRDKDLANAAVERDVGSDAQNPDTDGDGVKDGFEVFYLGTSPLLRDTDGDGIIDGIEDHNQNGKRDRTETDATKWDTDSDGLCDGICRVENGQKLRGEDKNVNGIVDSGESNPLLTDSDGDEILDAYEVYLCELKNGANC